MSCERLVNFWKEKQKLDAKYAVGLKKALAKCNLPADEADGSTLKEAIMGELVILSPRGLNNVLFIFTFLLCESV